MMGIIVELKIGVATATIEVVEGDTGWVKVVDLLVSMNSYAASKTPAFNPGQPMTDPRHSQAQNTDEFPITSIEVTESNGAKGVRVRGGAWSKFGVPLYSDSCRLPDDIRALLMSVPFGELTPPRNLTAKVLLRDGKPVKVLEVV